MALPEKFARIKQQIELGTGLPIRVVSGSMEPVIMTGDLIEVQPVQWEDLRVFDILLFWRGEDYLVCHYLWHVNTLPGPDGSQVIVTRALPGGEDLPVSREHIVGRIVSHKIPFSRKLRIILKHYLNRWRHRGLFE